MSINHRAARVLLGLLLSASALASCSGIDPNTEDGHATGEAAFIGATPPSPHVESLNPTPPISGASAPIIDPNPPTDHASASAIDGNPPHPHKGAPIIDPNPGSGHATGAAAFIDPGPPSPHATAPTSDAIDPTPETNH